jgi:hypothetical protein
MSDSNLIKTFTDTWGLWANYNWRDLAVNGGVVFTSAFLAYCVNIIEEGDTYSNVARYTVSFFVSYSAINYPKIQKSNQIKNQTLRSYMSVGQKLNDLEIEYGSKTESREVEGLVKGIKTSIKSCLNIKLIPTEEINSINQLSIVNSLMSAINKHIEGFKKTLSQTSGNTAIHLINEEKKIWDQSILIIKEQLLPTGSIYGSSPLVYTMKSN